MIITCKNCPDCKEIGLLTGKKRKVYYCNTLIMEYTNSIPTYMPAVCGRRVGLNNKCIHGFTEYPHTTTKECNEYVFDKNECKRCPKYDQCEFNPDYDERERKRIEAELIKHHQYRGGEMLKEKKQDRFIGPMDAFQAAGFSDEECEKLWGLYASYRNASIRPSVYDLIKAIKGDSRDIIILDK